jgi:hypothetical protein
VFSYRGEDRETSPVLQGLKDRIARNGHWFELDLQELAKEESMQLAGRLLADGGASAGVDLNRLVAESGGSPLFLQELVRSAGTGAAGLGLQQVILRRVDLEAAEIRQVLEVAALAGQALDVSQIVDVLGAAHSPGKYFATVERCIEEKLLRSAAGRERGLVEPYHDQIREAVAGSLAAGWKRELHARLAEVLSKQPGMDAERLIPHYEGAGNPKAAYQKAVEAARQAEALTAFDKAARLYRFATTLIGHSGNTTEDSLDLHSSLGRALALAGRGKQAAEVYAVAAELASTGVGRMRLKLNQCTQLLRGGYVDEGLAVFRAISDSLGRPVPTSRNGLIAGIVRLRMAIWWRTRVMRLTPAQPSELESLYCDLCCAAACCVSAVDILLSGFMILQLLDMRSRVKLNPRQSVLAMVYEGLFLAGDGPRNYIAASRIMAQAASMAKASNDPFALGMAQLSQATVAYLCGRLEELHQLSGLAEQTFREQCSGVVWELSSCQVLRLYAISWLGRVDEFSDGWKALAHEAQLRNDVFTSVSLKVLTYSHFPLLCRDGPEESTNNVLKAYGTWTREAFDLQRYGVISQIVETLIYSGRGLEAWDRVELEWKGYRYSQLHRWKVLDLMFLFMRGRTALAALGSGSHQKSGIHRDIRKTIRDLRRLGFEGGDACALALEGMMHFGTNPETASALLSQALQGFNSAGWGLYEMAATWRQAESAGKLDSIRADLETTMAKRGISKLEKLVGVLLPSPCSGKPAVKS